MQVLKDLCIGIIGLGMENINGKYFNEVLESGSPDFPFCLGWANHSWSRRTWNSSSQNHKDVDLMIQEYPGDADIISHFNNVLSAFKDKRYIRVDDKPIL